MAIDKNWALGVLLVVLLTSGVIYVAMDNVRLRVDNDKSTFYVKNDNNRWVVSGREYNNIFDGTTKMNRRASEITIEEFIDEEAETIKIIRTTPYIRGPVIKDIYTFDGKIDDVELFPIQHTVDIFNATGYFYRYEVRDLVYDGPTVKLNTTSASFGRNMKVEWDDDYRWAWLYKSGILKVQYDIPSDYEVFSVRLFDPNTPPFIADLTEPTDPTAYAVPLVFTANVTDDYAIDDVWMIINSVTYNSTNVSDIYSVTVPTITPGTYGYTWFANDTDGNIMNSTVMCYQESGNVQYNCGALSTGGYTSTGSWTNLANAYDGNWSSAAVAAEYNDSYVYFNYTKPGHAQRASSPWQVKDLNDTVNLTLPASCWKDELELRAESYYTGSYAWEEGHSISQINPQRKVVQTTDGSTYIVLNREVGGSNYGDIILYKRLAGEVSWTEYDVTNESDSVYDGQPSIVYDSTDNTLHIVYFNEATSSIWYIEWDVSTDTPVNPANEVAISSGSTDDMYTPSVAIQDDGTLGTCYEHEEGGVYTSIMFAECSGGCNETANWTETQLFYDSDEYQYYCIIDTNGTSWDVAWIGQDNTYNTQDQVMYRHHNGTGWEAIEVIDGDNAVAHGPASLIIKNGIPMVTSHMVHTGSGTDIVFSSKDWKYCYQETANVSTACGGLDTGAFTHDAPAPTIWYNDGQYIHDGNWALPASAKFNNISNGYTNYTKPNGATTTSVVQIKYTNATSSFLSEDITENLTITQDCWDQDPLQFKITSFSNLTAGRLYGKNFSCYNGTAWDVMMNNEWECDAPTDTNCYAAADFFEEGMYWYRQYWSEWSPVYNTTPDAQHDSGLTHDGTTLHAVWSGLNVSGADQDCLAYSNSTDNGTTWSAAVCLEGTNYTAGQVAYPHISYQQGHSDWDMFGTFQQDTGANEPLKLYEFNPSALYGVNWECYNTTDWVGLRSYNCSDNTSCPSVYEESMFWNLSVDFTTIKATPVINLTMDGHDSNWVVQNNTNVTFIGTEVTGQSDYIEIQENGSQSANDTGGSITYYENMTLGVYNMTAYVPATTNYTAGSESHILYVVGEGVGYQTLLDGLTINRTYEYATTANITSQMSNISRPDLASGTITGFDIYILDYGLRYLQHVMNATSTEVLIPLLNYTAIEVFTGGVSNTLMEFVENFYDSITAELPTYLDPLGAYLSISGSRRRNPMVTWDGWDAEDTIKSYNLTDDGALYNITLTLNSNETLYSGKFRAESDLTTMKFHDCAGTHNVVFSTGGVITYLIGSEIENCTTYNGTHKVYEFSMNATENGTVNISEIEMTFDDLGSYPTNVLIDTGDDRVMDVLIDGEVVGATVVNDEFSDGDTSKVLTQATHALHNETINITKTATATYTTLTFQMTVDDYADATTETFDDMDDIASSTLELDTFWGQVGNNLSGATFLEGTLISDVIEGTGSAISTVTATSLAYSETNALIHYFLQTDANGWVEVAMGTEYDLTSGENITYKIYIESDGTDSSYVDWFKINGMGSYPQDLLIDVGADGTYEVNETGRITTALRTVTLGVGSLNNYSCVEESCEVPINIQWTGIGNVTVSSLDSIYSLENMDINYLPVLHATRNEGVNRTSVEEINASSDIYLDDFNSTTLYLNLSRYIVIENATIDVEGFSRWE